MKVFPADLLQQLELDKVLAEVERRCISRPGKDRVGLIKPVSKTTEIRKLLSQTAEMMRVETVEDKFPFAATADNRDHLHKLSIENYVLLPDAIHQIRRMAVVCGGVIKFFDSNKDIYPQLFAFTEHIVYDKTVNKLVSVILDDDGNMRNDASPELVRIRKSLEGKQRELDKEFGAALRRLRSEGKLGDVEESMRNNRRVLGVASEYKRQVRGIIHDESETGKTTFIEPEAVVHVQNELFELEREEQREIYRIMKELTAAIAPFRELLEQYQWLLSIIDVNRAKARYALETGAAIPHIEDQPVVYLYHARHPVLSQLHAAQKKNVVPLDIEMDDDRRIVVISGPNAGGKSVAMKTVGLLVLMAQCGLPIPAADQSRIGVFTQIMADIGDSQSLEDELSTYSSRLMKMRQFLQSGNHKTLLLIDEFGTGTDPAMGGAIAEAALEALNSKKMFGVITTHYANLKSYAENHPGIANASMAFNEAELKPMYRLEMGKPGSSYAMEIAQKTQLPKELIDHARSLMSKEHVQFEQLLKSVRVEKEHLRLRERDLHKQEKDLLSREGELKARIQKNREKEAEFQRKRLEKQNETINKLEEEFRQHLKELKEAAPADEQAAREKLRSFIRDKKTEQQQRSKKLQMGMRKASPEGSITEGAWVTLLSGGDPGQVESIRNDKAVVVMGNLRSTVSLKELVLADKTATPMVVTRSKVKLAEEEAVTELDLRGMDKFEAMSELEKFLDGAMMRSVFQARIIHGMGTGVLRDAVHQVAKTHPGVRKYQLAVRENGGPGVTVVEFV
jgi:DNA mismatch repair protein MutS2